jgi:hypothetical protein
MNSKNRFEDQENYGFAYVFSMVQNTHPPRMCEPARLRRIFVVMVSPAKRTKKEMGQYLKILEPFLRQ